MKDYVSYRPPTQSKQDKKPVSDIPYLYYKAVIAIVMAMIMVFLSYNGYQLLTQEVINNSPSSALSTVKTEAKPGKNSPEDEIAKFNRNDNKWWYEKLLTEPVQAENQSGQIDNIISNAIPSKLRCGTFNTVERAQRLQNSINSLELTSHFPEFHEQAVVMQKNDKFVVWLPGLESRRLAEKLRHKILDANIGRCVIYDA